MWILCINKLVYYIPTMLYECLQMGIQLYLKQLFNNLVCVAELFICIFWLTQTTALAAMLILHSSKKSSSCRPPTSRSILFSYVTEVMYTCTLYRYIEVMRSQLTAKIWSFLFVFVIFFTWMIKIQHQQISARIAMPIKNISM